MTDTTPRRTSLWRRFVRRVSAIVAAAHSATVPF